MLSDKRLLIKRVLAGELIITEADKKRLQELIDDMMHFELQAKARVRDLDTELNNAEVVDAQQIPSDVITMNSKVLLAFGESEEEIIYSLVYPDEADMSNNKISVLAPIGTAILGYREGNIIEWKVPDGIVQVKVKKVLYQPEMAGDFNL